MIDQKVINTTNQIIEQAVLAVKISDQNRSDVLLAQQTNVFIAAVLVNQIAIMNALNQLEAKLFLNPKPKEKCE